MDAYLHPEGAKAIDEYGRKLLAFVGPITLENTENPFPSQRHVAAEITEKDIIGEMELNHVDIAGRIVRRIFLYHDTTHALHEEGCSAARHTAEKLIRMSKRLRSVAGTRFLESQIFGWARDTYRGAGTETLSAYLERKIAGAVRQHTIWFPLFALEVEEGFPLGPVHIRTITSDFFDRREELYSQRSHQDAESIQQMIALMRRELQGAAAVVVTMEAEPDHALAKGLELADAAAAILRIFSTASLSPWQSCPCAVRGSEHVPRFSAIRTSDDLEKFNWHRGLRDQDRHVFWRMSRPEALARLREGLAKAGELLADDDLGEFALRLRASLLTYARGLATTDLNDRLVQTLSALEALLLKDTSEPIQQNLGERMAFLIAEGTEDRLNVVRVLKDAYRMRSQYVHHLAQSADEQALEEFAFAAHMTFRAALINLDRFRSHLDFIGALDRMKFRG
jgi:hypothetical protein